MPGAHPKMHLFEWRALRGMSQRELAKKLDVSFQTIGHVEQGRHSREGVNPAGAALFLCGVFKKTYGNEWEGIIEFTR